MEFRQIATSSLKPWKGNPRKNDAAIAAVANSIAEFGFNAPILCDRRLNVIAGHTRLAAAKKLGISTVPVVILPLAGLRMRAYSVADNKTATIAEWDFAKLKCLLTQLRSDVDLSTIGFSREEVIALLEDEAPFDWDAFDRSLMESSEPQYVLLPVKVPVEAKQGLCQRITNYASRNDISGKDNAIVAGEVLALLLRAKS